MKLYRFVHAQRAFIWELSNLRFYLIVSTVFLVPRNVIHIMRSVYYVILSTHSSLITQIFKPRPFIFYLFRFKMIFWRHTPPVVYYICHVFVFVCSKISSFYVDLIYCFPLPRAVQHFVIITCFYDTFPNSLSYIGHLDRIKFCAFCFLFFFYCQLDDIPWTFFVAPCCT
jgi:hypothetical protein